MRKKGRELEGEGDNKQEVSDRERVVICTVEKWRLESEFISTTIFLGICVCLFWDIYYCDHEQIHIYILRSTYAI